MRKRLLILLLKYDRSLRVAYACWTWKRSPTSIACISKWKKIGTQTIGSEKPHQLTSVGELVFMASPTLACDGPREDSVEFVPVLFVAITRCNIASLDQETRVGEQMVRSDISTISTFTRLGHSDWIQKEELPRGTTAAGAVHRCTVPRTRCHDAALLSVFNQPETHK